VSKLVSVREVNCELLNAHLSTDLAGSSRDDEGWTRGARETVIRPLGERL
jgi:hypothetical protein